MRCSKCETEYSVGANVCTGCGQTLRPQPVCFSCQHVNALDRKFCSMCGAPLIQSVSHVIPSGAGKYSSASAEHNKAIVERLIDGLNRGNLKIINECMSPSFIRHSADAPDMGIEGFKHYLADVGVGSPKAAFQCTIEGMVCDGNNAAFRCTHRMTHVVPIRGIPPTGKRLTIKETFFSRFENGKIVEWWAMSDTSDLQRQLAPANEPVR